MPETPKEVIELRVHDIAQLFQTLDPYPFRERDIDRDAEDFIVGWAREVARQAQFIIRVYYRRSDAQAGAVSELKPAFTRHFAARADATQRDINELFRIGRWSLAIGLAILASCLALAHFGTRFFSAPFPRLFEESLLILGWVANWRPLEIFLYDWWPLARRRDLYRRLANADVEAVPEGGQT